MTYQTDTPEAVAARKAFKNQKRASRKNRGGGETEAAPVEQTPPVEAPKISSKNEVQRKRPKLIIAGVPKNASTIAVPGVIPNLSESSLAEDGTPVSNVHKKKDKKAQQLRKLIVGRKRTRDEGQSSSGISKQSCSEYLNQWRDDKAAWKFVKVRQTWLLQHMYNDDKVSDEDFEILVSYLGGLKGSAKDTTIEKAESLLAAADESSEDDTEAQSDDSDSNTTSTKNDSDKKTPNISEKQQSRAKDILQILS